ncbi:hypothetical protein [Pseudomonas sp. dw_358]|uniref:hypothetical protein n=1 Tax=Pseudomonas sp. dw_358 TaxID=2720083 RepID=UPI001BD5AE7B|nr:hypothetical protein [Pseudomonas sp. dw_358]
MQFKIGDTFLYLVTLNGVDLGELVGYTPTSQVRSLSGSLYSQVVCTWVDPDTTQQMQIYVADTSRWRPGPGFFDIQFARDVDGFTRSTITVPFTIVQDVTRL